MLTFLVWIINCYCGWCLVLATQLHLGRVCWNCLIKWVSEKNCQQLLPRGKDVKWRSETGCSLRCLGVRVKPGLNKESRGMKETTAQCGLQEKKPWLVKPHQWEAGQVNISEEMFGSYFTPSRPDSCGRPEVHTMQEGVPRAVYADEWSHQLQVEQQNKHWDPYLTRKDGFLHGDWPTQPHRETTWSNWRSCSTAHRLIDIISVEQCFSTVRSPEWFWLDRSFVGNPPTGLSLFFLKNEF